MQPNKFSQPIGQYISQFLKTNLLCETIYFQTQPAFIFLKFSNNNGRIKCEICSKLTIEATDIVLVSLLLTLNLLDTCLVFFWLSLNMKMQDGIVY